MDMTGSGRNTPYYALLGWAFGARFQWPEAAILLSALCPVGHQGDRRLPTYFKTPAKQETPFGVSLT